MKKILNFAFVALLFSCSTDKEIKTINVSFPEAGTNFISWLDIFPDIEMISLSGEQAPMLGSSCNLFVHDNIYYVADPFNTEKMYRFDQNGKFLNSIGSQGRGPEEYTTINDVLVDEQGNIVVYPYGEGVLVIYSPDGKFLEKREQPHRFQKYFVHNGFNYYYVGIYTGQDYQLYVTDDNGQAIGEFLPQYSSVPTSMPNAQTFSLFDDVVNFCPTYGNEISRLQGDKMEVKYRFDFGRYNIPDEFYKLDRTDLISFFSSNSMAHLDAFYESKHCAVLQVMIQGAVELDPIFAVGVLDKRRDVWKWFNVDWKTDFVFFPHFYFDEEHAYFMASAELMREVSGLIERFPLLNTVTEGNDTVILKCETKNIKL